jgi:hypothetical protein
LRQVKVEDLGLIRFTQVPQGGAPIEVREQWIGIEVSCLFTHDGIPLDSGDRTIDAATGFQVPDYPGYIVLQEDAIQALHRKPPEAAAWWKDHGFPQHSFGIFLFNLNSAEVLKPVMTRKEFWRQFNDA